MTEQSQQPRPPAVQPCRYKTGKVLGAGSYSEVKECVHIDTGRYYAAKVINKRLMAGREHMVQFPWSSQFTRFHCYLIFMCNGLANIVFRRSAMKSPS